VYRIAQDGDTVTFATGRYLDRVVEDDRALRFRLRRVVLDSRRVDILLVLPL
jgi:anthranilate 1,2-dioxygenase small subunit